MQHTDWDDLKSEFDAWAAAGRVAALWWRDDDAIEPSPALDRLLDLTGAHGIDLGLAVIPAGATEELATRLSDHSGVVVLQHGYRHRNHAPIGEPAIEVGGPRPVEEVLADMRAGFRQLQSLFGERFEPVLAAPWNRIAPPVLERLVEAGFRCASAMGPRAAMSNTGDLTIVNAHLDPINWKKRCFAGRDKALAGLIKELSDRRTGLSDPDEPLGLLTHHLDHDAALWGFLERLVEMTDTHPAAQWLSVRDAFGLSAAPRAVSA